MHPIPAAIAFLVKDAKVLLVKRGLPPNQGRWGLPGGKIEWGESIADAAVRELYEETGIRANADRVLTAIDVMGRPEHGDVQQHYVLIVVLCHWVSGEPVAGDDAADARWFAPAALLSSDIDLVSGVATVVDDCMHLIAPPS